MAKEKLSVCCDAEMQEENNQCMTCGACGLCGGFNLANGECPPREPDDFSGATPGDR